MFVQNPSKAVMQAKTSDFSYFSALIFPLEKMRRLCYICGREEPGRGPGPISEALPLSLELALSVPSSGSLMLSTGWWGTDSSSNEGQRAYELGTRWSRVSLSES